MKFRKIIHSTIPGDVTGIVELNGKTVMCHPDGTLSGELFLNEPGVSDLPTDVFEILFIGEQAAGRLARRVRNGL